MGLSKIKYYCQTCELPHFSVGFSGLKKKFSVAAVSKWPHFYSDEIILSGTNFLEIHRSFRNPTVTGITRGLKKEVEFSSCVFSCPGLVFVFLKAQFFMPKTKIS